MNMRTTDQRACITRLLQLLNNSIVKQMDLAYWVDGITSSGSICQGSISQEKTPVA